MIKTVSTSGEYSHQLTFGSQVYQRVSYHLIRKLSFLPSFERYNITICHEKKFIWFRVAKVGTRTIFNLLKSSKVYLDAEHPFKCYYPKSRYDDYFKFAFVRNPYDRLVSCWKNKVVDSNHFRFSEQQLIWMQDFGNFVEFLQTQNVEKTDPHIRLQSKLIDLNSIDYIGRYENFEKDLSPVLKNLDIDFDQIPRMNLSNNKRPYKSYYTENLKAKVAQIYRKDLNLFSYAF